MRHLHGMQTILPRDGQVAQSVEQGTENPRVGSSILSLATIFSNPINPELLFDIGTADGRHNSVVGSTLSGITLQFPQARFKNATLRFYAPWVRNDIYF